MDAVVFVAAVVFGLFGVVMLGFAVALTVSTTRFMSRADHVTGTVIEVVGRETWSSEGGRTTNWYPVVEYPARGRVYRIEGRTGGAVWAHRVGAAVPVAFDPSDPSAARLSSFQETHAWNLMLFVMGLGFLGGGWLWTTMVGA